MSFRTGKNSEIRRTSQVEAGSERRRKPERIILAAIIALLVLPSLPVQTGQATHGAEGTSLWAYQSSSDPSGIEASTFLEYDIGTDAFVEDCLPTDSDSGRGIAYDPYDRQFWYTFLDFPIFTGNGYIYKASALPDCETQSRLDPPLPLPFAEGPGGDTQDDIGALDIDPDDGHIWAAGYRPNFGEQLFYKISRSTGEILQTLSIPTHTDDDRCNGTLGNDSMAVARLDLGDGLRKYLLTDGGELCPFLMAIEVEPGGGTVKKRGIFTYDLPVGIVGIDFEDGKLIAAGTDLDARGVPIFSARGFKIYDLGGPPFDVVHASMDADPGVLLEDITLKTPGIVPRLRENFAAVLTRFELVPPLGGGGGGFYYMTLGQGGTSIAFSLTVEGLDSSTISLADLRVAPPGQNGPGIFVLFNRASEGVFQGLKTGSLSFNDLIPQPNVGVNNFTDAVGKIASGLAYVEVHTDQHPEGELRGQVRLNVLMDIKPGTNSNDINLKSKGSVPVAILTSPSFDALTLHISTVRFGRTGREASVSNTVPSLQDIDGDGDLDWILQFRIQDTGFTKGDDLGILTGRAFDGSFIIAADAIRTF